jgi:hypothetical protein
MEWNGLPGGSHFEFMHNSAMSNGQWFVVLIVVSVVVWAGTYEALQRQLDQQSAEHHESMRTVCRDIAENWANSGRPYEVWVRSASGVLLWPSEESRIYCARYFGPP